MRGPTTVTLILRANPNPFCIDPHIEILPGEFLPNPPCGIRSHFRVKGDKESQLEHFASSAASATLFKFSLYLSFNKR